MFVQTIPTKGAYKGIKSGSAFFGPVIIDFFLFFFFSIYIGVFEFKM